MFKNQVIFSILSRLIQGVVESFSDMKFTCYGIVLLAVVLNQNTNAHEFDDVLHHERSSINVKFRSWTFHGP